jgi:putative SOS response-associated peptidase YedK
MIIKYHIDVSRAALEIIGFKRKIFVKKNSFRTLNSSRKSKFFLLKSRSQQKIKFSNDKEPNKLTLTQVTLFFCRTLQPNEICLACKYKEESKSEKSSKTDKEKFVQPEWRAEFNCGKSYQPSFNVCPQDICPVLVSAKHFDPEKNSSDRIVVPMLWGMIPVWHKGDYRKHGLTTNNCRLEHLPTSKLYSGPFQKGQRCVVIVEGFYEWQTTKNEKSSARAAYYIYVPQNEGIKIEDKSSWTPDVVKLLRVAGLYDTWHDADGNLMYSYTVITFESDKKLDWMHHRSPAILDTDQQVADWLDFERVPSAAALKLLKKPQNIIWHRVSNAVNNSRNKVADCNKPMEQVKKEDVKTPKSKMMQAWLVSKKRKSTDGNEEGSPKKVKSDKSDEN